MFFCCISKKPGKQRTRDILRRSGQLQSPRQDEGFCFCDIPQPAIRRSAILRIRASVRLDGMTRGRAIPPRTRLSGDTRRGNLYRIACCGSHCLSPYEQYQVRR
jgi:hypothetical protein